MEVSAEATPSGGSGAPKYVVLLTIPEVATTLRISRSSVYRLFDSGQVRWVTIGSSHRVSSAEIDRFISDHTGMAAS
jgi:excisionase family DNA binding protein